MRHNGFCSFWKSSGFLGSIGKLFSFGESQMPGLVVTQAQSWVFSLRADAAFYSSLRPRHILHRAWHLLLEPGKKVCLLERRGWWRELLLKQNKAASLRLAVWVQSAGMRRAAGGVAPVLDIHRALCQMQDRRAVSFSPAKWRGSRSFSFFFFY